MKHNLCFSRFFLKSGTEKFCEKSPYPLKKFAVSIRLLGGTY